MYKWNEGCEECEEMQNYCNECFADMYTTLKQLPQAIKSLRLRGFEVCKLKIYIDGRQAYNVYTDSTREIGRTVTDYQVLHIASHGSILPCQ